MHEENKEDEAERLHFQKVVNSFKVYKQHSLRSIKKREDYLNTLPAEHQKLLRKNGYETLLTDLKLAVDANDEIIGHILKDVDHVFENLSHENRGEKDKRVIPTSGDMEKVQACLKQLVRDWTEAGRQERDECYSVIMDQLDKLYPEATERAAKKILVPGAGLGRLAFEIARMGFECQGNEFSLFMLFTSNFVLNKCKSPNVFKIHPYIHNFCNNMSDRDQLTPITFPDVDPNMLPEDSKFSMAAGDFLDVYNEAEYVGSLDTVVTCFFMDCAHNILDFMQTIHRVLKKGGHWINLGPLLYHFSDIPGEFSIEPSYECILGIAKDMGFEFLVEETNVRTNYDQNPRNMLKYTYDSAFFVCQKL